MAIFNWHLLDRSDKHKLTVVGELDRGNYTTYEDVHLLSQPARWATMDTVSTAYKESLELTIPALKQHNQHPGKPLVLLCETLSQHFYTRW